MSSVIVRSFDYSADADGAARLDASFSTRCKFAVEKSAEGLILATVALEADIEKRFPLVLNRNGWTEAFAIAEGVALRGFIATAVSEWNKRLIIREFFVDRPHRRRGFGRRLLERAVKRGTKLGMTTAFVETSNLNHPGVIAYQRLGFALCGFDLSLYAGALCPGEFALFLSRDLKGVDAPREAKG